MSAQPTLDASNRETTLEEVEADRKLLKALVAAANVRRQQLLLQEQVALQQERAALQQWRAALEQQKATLQLLNATLLMQQQAGPPEHDVDPNYDNEAEICGLLEPYSPAKQPMQALFSWLFHRTGQDQAKKTQ